MATVMRKQIGCIVLFIFLLLTGWAQTALIPQPVEYAPTKWPFVVNAATVIVCPDKSPAKLLNRYIGKQLAVTTTGKAGNYISLQVDAAQVTQVAGYRLQVEKKGITLLAHDAAGIVHGIQTLRQLWQREKNTFPGCIIIDYPRFSYRGMSLDVGRHMFPVSFIKQYIDQLALYKFNRFHWHLTDDQGWRIEIKKYPRLQSVAAWRDETLIGHKKELPHRFDGKRYGGYYTQEQIKEVVQYAAERQITIIPEIEMPGHALAALAAYPGFGCTGGPYKTANYWGIFDDVFCAGNDSVFTFLQDVLDEVMQLFPSTSIHIGGDECVKTKWKACAKCQQRIKTLGLSDEHALQSYFIQRIEKYVNSKGRQIIGWDEILEGGLAPNATVMSWRGEAGGREAAHQKHPVIMTPESHCYFDYYQSLHPNEPLAAGGYTPLQKVYAYEPLRDSSDSTLLKYITGIEGQAWSEYFVDTAQALYMIFPRALALAEVAWSPVALRNYDDFLRRLRARGAYRLEKVFKPPVRIHKATGAKVVLKSDPVERFNPGAAVLVNGIAGNNRYNDGQWLGFSGHDCEVVIDLDSLQTINTVGLHVLNYHWQRMWAPVEVLFFASADGNQFTQVYRHTSFPVNGINTIEAGIAPVQTRYIKVLAKNKGIIPPGEYGAGGKALLLIDEIIIDFKK
jgi:hexosaminidase